MNLIPSFFSIGTITNTKFKFKNSYFLVTNRWWLPFNLVLNFAVLPGAAVNCFDIITSTQQDYGYNEFANMTCDFNTDLANS